MQKDMNDIFDNANDQLTKEAQVSKHIVESNANQLIKMKEQSTKINDIHPTVDIDSWELDYDE
jgi:hypothetical protein